MENIKAKEGDQYIAAIMNPIQKVKQEVTLYNQRQIYSNRIRRNIKKSKPNTQPLPLIYLSNPKPTLLLVKINNIADERPIIKKQKQTFMDKKLKEIQKLRNKGDQLINRLSIHKIASLEKKYYKVNKQWEQIRKYRQNKFNCQHKNNVFNKEKQQGRVKAIILKIVENRSKALSLSSTRVKSAQIFV